MLQPLGKDTGFQPRTHEPQVTLKVDCRVGNGHVVEGYRIPFGVSELTVPQTTAAEIIDLVEDESVELAERTYHKKMAAWCDKHGQPEDKYPGSPAKEFQSVHLRGIKPFVSVQVLADDLEPELTPDQKSIAAVARTVRGMDEPATTRKGKGAK